MLKDHEKLIVFLFLGAALMVFGLLLYLRPLPDNNTNSGALQILNMIVGAIIGAFGAATAQLLKATVTVDNKTTDPIPTAPVTESDATQAPATPKEELPEYAR